MMVYVVNTEYIIIAFLLKHNILEAEFTDLYNYVETLSNKCVGNDVRILYKNKPQELKQVIIDSTLFDYNDQRFWVKGWQVDDLLKLRLQELPQPVIDTLMKL